MASKNEIEILVTAEVDKALKNIKKVESTTKAAGKDIDSTLKKSKTSWIKFGVAAAGALAVKALVKFGVALTNSARDAEETRNKFTVVFKGMEDESTAAAVALAKNFGLANEEAERLIGNTADLVQGLGLTKTESLDVATSVNELAADLASFNNKEVKDASKALLGLVTGEREMAKQFGIIVNDKTLIEFAAQNGVVYKSLSKTEQGLLALKLATEQSKNSIGDFQRSQSSLANQGKILNANIENLKVSLGNKLIPVVTSATSFIAKMLSPDDDLSNQIEELNALQKEHSGIVKTLSENYDTLTETEKGALKIRKDFLEIETKSKALEIAKELNQEYKSNAIWIANIADAQVYKNKLLKDYNALADKEGKTFIEKIRLGGLSNEVSRADEKLLKSIATQKRISAKLDSDLLVIGRLLTEGKLDKLTADKLSLDVTKEATKRHKDSIVAQENEAKATKNSIVAKKENKKAISEVTEEVIKSTETIVDSAAEEIAAYKTKDAAFLRTIDLQKQTFAVIGQFLSADLERLQNNTDQRLAILAEANASELLALDTQLQARLEKEGLADLTAVEQAQAKLDALNEIDIAKLTADEKTAHDEEVILANSELKKQKIIADFAEKKLVATDKYEAEKLKTEQDAAIESAKIKIKQAKLEKAGALAEIAFNTGTAIAKAYAASPLTFGAPWSVAAGAMGLLQAGAVLNEPLPTLPAFAEGGVSDGGLALVGERGAEIVDLPRGARVIPNNQSNSYMNKNSVVVENITLPNVSNGEQFYNELQAVQRQYGQMEFG